MGCELRHCEGPFFFQGRFINKVRQCLVNKNITSKGSNIHAATLFQKFICLAKLDFSICSVGLEIWCKPKRLFQNFKFFKWQVSCVFIFCPSFPLFFDSFFPWKCLLLSRPTRKNGCAVYFPRFVHRECILIIVPAQETESFCERERLRDSSFRPKFF